MKIESQPLENHQVKLTVEVEPDVLESAKQRAARQLAKRTKIPGFRPGKAPYAVIVRQLGEAHILEEAMDLLVNDIYPKVIEESGVHPYGPGSLEKISSMEPPVLEFVIPLEAEVKLGDYKSIRNPYEPKEVSEQDVSNVLQDLRERQAVIEPVERPALEGDLVTVRLSAHRTQEEEGQDPTLIRERSMPVIIHSEAEEGQEAEKEWPFPGFGRGLIGLSAGDERSLTHTFPEDADFESLRGVEAEFHFTVENVKSRILPELNDEFATTVGEYADLAALQADIRQSLEQQAKESYDSEYEEKILDEAVSQSEIQYPPQMLDREIDSVVDSLKNRLEQQKLDMDLYLKTRSMDMAGLRDEARPVAETRLRKSLVLLEIAKADNIQVEQDELQNETMRTMDALSRSLPEKEARRLGNRDVFSSLVGSVMADMLTHKSMEHLRDIASGQADKQAEQAAAEAEQADQSGEAEASAAEAAGTADAVQAEKAGAEEAGEKEAAEPSGEAGATSEPQA